MQVFTSRQTRTSFLAGVWSKLSPALSKYNSTAAKGTSTNDHLSFLSDYGKVKPDSLLAIAAGGRRLYTMDENKAQIKAAGFINMRTKV